MAVTGIFDIPEEKKDRPNDYWNRPLPDFCTPLGWVAMLAFACVAERCVEAMSKNHNIIEIAGETSRGSIKVIARSSGVKR